MLLTGIIDAIFFGGVNDYFNPAIFRFFAKNQLKSISYGFYM